MTILPIGQPPKPKPLLSRPLVSRRRIIQLGLATTVAACAPQSAEQARQAADNGIVPWPHDVRVPPVFHPGYGMTPDYEAIGDTGPWPKILPGGLRRAVEKYADLILPGTATAPAPSAVGIADFFDDWTSAPYPWMADTRRIVHQGFAWLDAQAAHDFGTNWMGTSEAQAKALLDRMRDGDPDNGPMTQQANMYVQLRPLILGAYYTSPEGEADLGHVPPAPIAGDYPGPTGEALDHIKGVIEAQGLEWDDLPIGPPPYDLAPYTFTGDDPA